MGYGSNDFQAGMGHADGMAAATAVGRSVAKHGLMGHLFPTLRKPKAPASTYDEIDGHVGVKAEALRELARYNPAHPLLNRAYRERLFDQYASGKLKAPDAMPDSQFAKDPDA